MSGVRGIAFSVWVAVVLHACVAGAQSAEPAARAIAVIVSESWEGAERISMIELRRAYLGSRRQLFGERLVRFHLRSGSAVRAGFTRSVMGRSESAMDEYWVEQALTGGRIPPREVASARELFRAVRKRKGAIGYVPYSELLELAPAGIRILALGRGSGAVRPASPDYPIRARQ